MLMKLQSHAVVFNENGISKLITNKNAWKHINISKIKTKVKKII